MRRVFTPATPFVSLFASLWLAGLTLRPAEARVLSLDLQAVEAPAFGGMTFGANGQYERITGIAHGEIDPADPANAGIQDLALAPRAPDGKIAYATPFVILMPIEADRGNHVLLYDVVNRGRPLAPGLYNRGGGASDIGDGFLERQGFALVWSGWQGDLSPKNPLAFPPRSPICPAVVSSPARCARISRFSPPVPRSISARPISATASPIPPPISARPARC